MNNYAKTTTYDLIIWDKMLPSTKKFLCDSLLTDTTLYMFPFLDPRERIYPKERIYPTTTPVHVHVLRYRANARREKCVGERIHKQNSYIIHVVLCSPRELFPMPQFFAHLHEV